jgi:hypothetical protein
MRDAFSRVVPKAPHGRFFRAAALAALLLGPVMLAIAAPPENADPALSQWFRSLRQPGTGISCCSMADCRMTDYRVVGEGYEALIDGTWRTVPPERVLDHTDNPTGRAVVCYLPSKGVLCFVRPSET